MRSMVVKTVVHFEIPAWDGEKLTAFYEQVFGWKIQKNTMSGGMEYWLISTGPQGKSVGGGIYKKTGPEERPRNFILVDQIDPAIKKFKSAGGTEVVSKRRVPDMGWSFIGADPEGNLIGLFEATMPRPRSRGSAARPRRRR